MIVRDMTRADLDSVVRIHLRAFSGFFLSFLGPRFLRAFYGAVMRRGIALVAVDGEVVGFAAGVVDSRGFYRRLLREDAVAIAFAIVPAVLRRPSTLLRVLRRVKQRAAGGAAETPPGAELMSIAVDPSRWQRGAGRELLRAFVDGVRRRGVTALWLVTDSEQNDAVRFFYERLGFSVRRVFTNAEGRALVEYVRSSEPLD